MKTKDQKTKKLKAIRSIVIDQFYKEGWKEVWFYPPHDGVDGYMGTQDIIFVGLNPATANFPSWHDKMYYRNLKTFGFKNAHITDLFKVRATNQEVKDKMSGWDFKEAGKILKSEIETIEPRLIVLLGKSVEEIYCKMFPPKEVKDTIKVLTTKHYAYRYGSKKDLRRRIRKEMIIIADEYKKASK
jgi:hypothetical protein